MLREVGEITVTRHGQPVARLLSIRTRRAKPTHAELRASMKRLRQPSERLVREDRDAR
jgi:prevent-host-death family protein